MKKKVIATMAVTAAVMFGGVFSAYALPAEAQTDTVAAAMEKYEQKLADYRKDMAAYEADPNEWTAEVPRVPEKPAGAVDVVGQEHARR
ncbi:MAG: hypothetical protein HYS23_13835 [Geobacter sp.]|nr:hypothetical protein [Geobacter sp.]